MPSIAAQCFLLPFRARPSDRRCDGSAMQAVSTLVASTICSQLDCKYAHLAPPTPHCFSDIRTPITSILAQCFLPVSRPPRGQLSLARCRQLECSPQDRSILATRSFEPPGLAPPLPRYVSNDALRTTIPCLASESFCLRVPAIRLNLNALYGDKPRIFERPALPKHHSQDCQSPHAD
jgi:hypothetical protein